MQLDTWHFARPSLAKNYLAMFDIGLTSARGIFARRRMGKTQFINHDLLPAASEQGYLTAYANLWSNKNDPGQAVVVALNKAMEKRGLNKAIAALKQPIKKIKGSGKLTGVGEASIEADLSESKAQGMTLLQECLTLLDKQKKKMLLVLDEAQVLALEDHTAFAHALRTALDVRKERVKVIFAGSAEGTLRSMFGRPSAPFYNWAVLEPFPLLDAAFVKAMVAKTNSITRYPLKQADAQRAFQELHETPEFFRSYLNSYLINPQSGSQAALEQVKSQHLGGENFELLWHALLPADRALLRLLAGGVTDLHSESALVAVGAALGLEGKVNKSTPLNTLRRLTARNTLTKIEHGKYQFEDPAFKLWVQHDAL
jgi:hypothetical protein